MRGTNNDLALRVKPVIEIALSDCGASKVAGLPVHVDAPEHLRSRETVVRPEPETSDLGMSVDPAAERRIANRVVQSSLPIVLGLGVTDMLGHLDVDALVKTSKATAQAVAEQPDRLTASRAIAAVSAFADAQTVLDDRRIRAARTAMNVRRIAFSGWMLPLNVATLFIPALVVSRFFVHKRQSANEAAERHASLPLVNVSPCSALLGTRKAAFERIRFIQPSLVLRDELRAQIREHENTLDDRYDWHDYVDNLFSTLACYVFSGGLYLLWQVADYGLRKAHLGILHSRLDDVSQICSGTDSAGLRALTTIAMASDQPEFADYRKKLGLLKRAEEDLVVGVPSRFSEEEAAALSRDPAVQQRLTDPAVQGSSYRHALNLCYRDAIKDLYAFV